MAVQRPPDAEQIQRVRDFIMLLSEQIKQSTQHFETLSKVAQQELLVLRILVQHGPLMVKDVARHLGDVSLSTLTRILDRLESQHYITRALNQQDRRSFQISLTVQGRTLVERYHEVMGTMAQAILDPLTPTERLIMLELYDKIQTSLAISPVESTVAEQVAT